MSQRSEDKLSRTRAATASTSQPRRQLLMLGSLSASILIVLVAAAWALLAGPKEAPQTAETPVALQSPPPKLTVVADTKPQPSAKKPIKNAKQSVTSKNDDPLWVSPTKGAPLNLGFLPPGAQLIAVLRPAALL